MKIRNGFVSNSSSSSFIIEADNSEFKNCFDIAKYMISCREYGEEKNKNKKLIEKLEQALKNKIITEDTNIMFRSCNYDTYIIKDYNYDKIYISTCNNHEFPKLYGYEDSTEGELCNSKKDNNRFYYVEEGIFITYLPYDCSGENRRCNINPKKCYGEIFKADDGNNYCINCEIERFKVKKINKPIKSLSVKELIEEIEIKLNELKERIK